MHGFLTIVFTILASNASAFYLPGSAPKDYAEGDPVPLLVNALTPQLSQHSKLKSVLSYDYYHPRFHFCQPDGGPRSQRESFGSVLFGDRLYNSPFEVSLHQCFYLPDILLNDVPRVSTKMVHEVEFCYRSG